VDRLRVLDLRRTDDNLQSRFWRNVVAFSFGHRGGLSAGHLDQLGGSSGSSLGLQCQAFNGHRFGNSATLGFSTCQQEDMDYSPLAATNTPRGYLLLCSVLTFEDHMWFEDRWMVASLCDE
jgi:hypothetical protein